MERANCRQRLGEVLSRAISCATSLLQILDAEKTALAGRDPAPLETAIKAKQRCLEELDEFDRRRVEIMQTAGFTPDRPGVEDCLRWCDSEDTLSSRWQQLMSLLAQCRDHNLVNGRIMEANRHRTEGALAILRGQQPDAKLYGPAGEQTTGPLSRTLGWV